jgi:hypothetical protein
MNIKKTLTIILTVMTLLLAGVMSFFQYLDMLKNQDIKADEILRTVSYELKKGQISEDTVKMLKPNFFHVIWHKTGQNKWIPVIYDRNAFDFSAKSPEVPQHFARSYSRTIDNNEFVIWINSFNIDYYLQYIGIMLLTILLAYLVLMLLVTLVFSRTENETEDYVDFDNESSMPYGQSGISDEYDFDEYKYEDHKTGDGKISADYKELWMKHFKISDHFKENFPFEKIMNLVRFGAVPSTYLNEALLISREYFNWINPKIYLRQNGKFIDGHSKSVLDESAVNIPLKGDAKGDIYIPLFPYNSSSVFGYLNYTWKNDYLFHIADILYFLKLLFSEDAKFIFTDSVKNEKILDELKTKFDRKNNEVFAAILSVDNKHKFFNILKNHQITKVDRDFFNRILADFRKDTAFYIRPFYYGIIGDRVVKEKQISVIEEWINNENKHNYSVDNEFGNIAITFSCGLSFKGDRNISPQTLINEAENYRKIAGDQGGNQVVYS